MSLLLIIQQPMATAIESSIIIEAPAAKVWPILVDLDSYDQWNTFTPQIDCDKVVGHEVTLHVAWKPGQKPIQQKEELRSWEPGKKLEWGITKQVFLKTVRIQTVEDLGNGTCRYYTRDDFWGPLTGVVMLFYRKKVQGGFDRVATDLKRFVEKR
ncbi:MAG: SRPBCC domain-containing protein [Bacteroidota bacterium]